MTRQRIPDDILAAAHDRARARNERDWAEADRLRAWVGDVRFSPGFLPPFQRELGA